MYKSIKIKKYIKFIFNFFLINIFTISNKRVTTNGVPICSQKLYIRGNGHVKIGKNCTFGSKFGGFFRNGDVEIQARYKNSIVNIGNMVRTNNNIFILAANKIFINDNTLIGQNVTIMDFEAHDINPNNRNSVGKIGEIYIGKNVWIGNNVIILKNSIIGNNSIIAAGAVVSGKFPNNVVIGGVPAKIIKHI